MANEELLARIELLEAVLLEYVARYGVTDLAVAAFGASERISEVAAPNDSNATGGARSIERRVRQQSERLVRRKHL
jgi:hypothetical protein